MFCVLRFANYFTSFLNGEKQLLPYNQIAAHIFLIQVFGGSGSLINEHIEISDIF